MKTNTFIDEDKLVEKAIKILMEHLGPVETKRFLSLTPKKRMDSIKRHRLWQARLDKKSFFDEIFKS